MGPPCRVCSSGESDEFYSSLRPGRSSHLSYGERCGSVRALEKAAALDLANQLADKIVVVQTKVGENGRLFGAITSKEIASAITEQTGIEVDRRKIILDKPIKETGVETLEIKLFQDVKAKVVVKIEGGK